MPVSNALREKYHRTARFWPAHRDEEGKLCWPALEVAGALVFVYVDGNTLRVSVDLDTPHRGIVERPNTRSTIPLHITVQGTTVFYAPSERSGDRAWRVIAPDGDHLLFTDGQEHLALAAADGLGGLIQFRRAQDTVWIPSFVPGTAKAAPWWKLLYRRICRTASTAANATPVRAFRSMSAAIRGRLR
ncbi:hypothetical protein ACFWXO_13485 [Kitasatospora sp. NPDC059088]|uniref:hypothetical protein n=1 Tax=Kitasatospora sp. NPDC059088 TaxID=3346722 RepID=UPI003677076A